MYFVSNVHHMTEWHDRFKHRLAELKRTEHLTQEKLAERLGVTQSAIGHWLSGRREPRSFVDYRNLARALKVDFNWLLFGDETDRPVERVPPQPIPILRPEQVLGWCQNSEQVDVRSNDIVYMASLDSVIEDRIYAVTLSDNGMFPRFTPGDKIIITPGKTPTPGNTVAIDFSNTGQISIGKLTREGPSEFLAMQKTSIELPENWQTLFRGVVCGAIFESFPG